MAFFVFLFFSLVWLEVLYFESDDVFVLVFSLLLVFFFPIFMPFFLLFFLLFLCLSFSFFLLFFGLVDNYFFGLFLLKLFCFCVLLFRFSSFRAYFFMLRKACFSKSWGSSALGDYDEVSFVSAYFS